MNKEIGKPHFVPPDLGAFADASHIHFNRRLLQEKFARELKRRTWFAVGECKLRLGGVYIIRRVYGQAREDQVLSPALAIWGGYDSHAPSIKAREKWGLESGWKVISGGTEPERMTVSYIGGGNIQVLGKLPIFSALWL